MACRLSKFKRVVCLSKADVIREQSTGMRIDIQRNVTICFKARTFWRSDEKRLECDRKKQFELQGTFL